MAKDWRGKGGYDLDSDKDRELEVVEEGYGKYRRPDAEDPEDKKNRLRRAGTSLRIAVVVLVVIIGGILYLSLRPETDTAAEDLNSITSLSGATIVYSTLDTAAVSNIKRRFGETGAMLPFVDGAVVSLLFAEHAAEIWVGESTLDETAGEAHSLLISATNPDYSPVWDSQIEETRGTTSIIRLAGRGQINYFFRSGRYVVWIAADPTAAPVALNAALNSDIAAWLQTVEAEAF